MMISTYLLLLSAACILSEGLHPLPQTRIINGKYIEIERAPWQVSLQFNGEHYCGGSVYSDSIIITAAHCFYLPHPPPNGPLRLLDNKEILIVAGSEFKRSREIIAAVSTKMHHDDYNSLLFPYDIGIMKLVNPLPISKQVKPIPLALKNPAPGSVVLSTGWGLIEGRNSPLDPPISPEVLQGLDLTIQNSDSCNIIRNQSMRYDVICFKTAGKSACNGDSGGPLAFKNTLVGVVSFGEHNCSGLAAYASVAYRREWLVKEIKSISKK